MLSTYLTLFNSHYPYFGDEKTKVAKVIWLVKWKNLWIQVKAVFGLISEPKANAINLNSYYLLYSRFSQFWMWTFDENAVRVEVNLTETKIDTSPSLSKRKKLNVIQYLESDLSFLSFSWFFFFGGVIYCLHLYFKNLYFILEYSWLTTLCFRYKVIQLHVYVYSFFFRFFPHISYYRILSRVSCAIYVKLLLSLFFR